MPPHAALSPAAAQSPRSRATPAWSAGSSVGPVRPPEGERRRQVEEDQAVEFETEAAFCAVIVGGDRPPVFQPLTCQTDSGRAGKATPPYAARLRRHQSRPDGAALSPHMSENKTIISSQQFHYLTLG